MGAVLGLAALLRLIALALWPDLETSFPDAFTYRQAGVELFTRGRISSDIVMPLYPVWSFVTGGGVGQKLADVVLSVLTVAVVHSLTLELFQNRLAALVSATLASVYPFFIYYAVAGVTETAYVLIVCAAFLALYRGRFGLGSVLLVASVLTRPTLDILAPILVVVFSALVHRAGWRLSAKRVATYAAVYAALMSPWWLHNYDKYGTFVRLNLGDGLVLYYGNNCPMMDAGVMAGATGPRECADFSAIADPIERNDALKAATAQFVLDHPLHFAKLAALKFVAFWRPYVYTPDWKVKAASLLTYGVVLAIACVFLLLAWRTHIVQLSPIILFGAYLTAVHVVTLAYIRYRLPLEPFLIAFASYASTDRLMRTLRPETARRDRGAFRE